MATFSERLRLLRTQKGLSQMEFAKQIGVSKSSVNMYERGEREPGLETLELLADYFNVDMDYLLGKSDFTNKYEWFHNSAPGNIIPLPEMKKIPRIGRIACGDPITAEENIEEYDEYPSGWHADFSLLCVGDSMSPKIEDGDIVAIRCQQEVHNGEIAAVRIGDEATLKMVFLHQDYVELRPVNPAYPSIIRRLNEMEEIRIEGKAVGLCRNL